MLENLSKIRDISEAVAESHEAFLVDLTLRGERKTQVLEVFVDTDGGITADRCAAISRDLSARLDLENLLSSRYNLIVSSPGLDRPLKLRRQYKKNVGRNLKIRFVSAAGLQNFVGRLVEVSEEAITLQEKGRDSTRTIPFDIIEESKVEIEFGHPRK
jgi:ribosome maturation factor RimP